MESHAVSVGEKSTLTGFLHTWNGIPTSARELPRVWLRGERLRDWNLSTIAVCGSHQGESGSPQTKVILIGSALSCHPYEERGKIKKLWQGKNACLLPCLLDDDFSPNPVFLPRLTNETVPKLRNTCRIVSHTTTFIDRISIGYWAIESRPSLDPVNKWWQSRTPNMLGMRGLHAPTPTGGYFWLVERMYIRIKRDRKGNYPIIRSWVSSSDCLLLCNSNSNACLMPA